MLVISAVLVVASTVTTIAAIAMPRGLNTTYYATTVLSFLAGAYNMTFFGNHTLQLRSD